MTVSLLLVQHGISLSKDEDPEQGLAWQGVADVKRIAQAAARHGVQVSSIRHSGKKRAQQTADILATALEPEQGVTETAGLLPLDDVLRFAATIDVQQNLLLVGHLPFMGRLTSYLITGSTDRSVFRFQNAGILCLDHDEDSESWVIKWALMPHID